MKRAHYNWRRLATPALTLLLIAGLAPAQEGFKGGGTVFTRTVKKAHSAKRPAAARIPPRASEANNRGDAHFDAGRYEDAVTAYQEAIKLFPRFVDALVNLGDALRELKRYDEAVNAYKQVVKLSPKNGDAYIGLSDAYEALGRRAEADEAQRSANATFASGGVLNGKAISLPKPAYPPIARAAHASGTVIVQVLIDETGQVIRAHAISGHPLLQAAAVKAASEAVFSPFTLSGQPVKVSGTIAYNFALQ
jgi:TonB family protein